MDPDRERPSALQQHVSGERSDEPSGAPAESTVPEPLATAAATPRPITGGAIMSGLSLALVSGASALTTLAVARLLGPAATGAYAVAVTVIAMLTALTTLGVEHGIVYYVSSRRWSARDAFHRSQLVALVCGAAGAGLGLLVRLLVPSLFSGLSLAGSIIVVAALPFSLSWFYASYVALATDRYERYVVPAPMQALLALCLVAILGALDGITGVVIGLALSHMLTAVVMLLGSIHTFRSSDSPTQPAAPRTLRRAIGFGVKGYASNALQLLNYRLDLLILNAAVASAVVGQYSVAVGVTSVMWLLPQAISGVLFPRVAALSAEPGTDAERNRHMVETKSMRHTTLATLVLTIVLTLALLYLVVPIYGPGFAPSVDLGLILLPGGALLGLSGPIFAIIVGRGRPQLSLAATAIVTPVTVLLYVILIPALHAYGAALASTLSYAATFALSTVFYRRLTFQSAFPQLLPTRSEIADYHRLVLVATRWLSDWRLRSASR